LTLSNSYEDKKVMSRVISLSRMGSHLVSLADAQRAANSAAER
jgi:hypothetical protein